MGKLFIVPTPIGNLEDITMRGLRLLKEAELIIAEDTRTTGMLLKHYSIENKRLQSFHLHNEHNILNSIIDKIQSNEVTILVSDAGTPGISDPGFLLIRECVKNEIEVECLPGATAFVPALVDSGFPTDRFVFEGFLPQKKGRQTKIKALAEETRTMIFYESPFRLVKALEQFSEVFGVDRHACVCREISKFFEEKKRGTLQELITYYTAKPPKGEIVIVVEGLKD